MPYSNVSELPDSIKNSLPAEAQNIWMKAFNSAASQYPDDETKAIKIAWGAVKNAGWTKEGDKWIKKMTQTHEFNTEILAVGTWNGYKFAEDDLKEIADNFNLLKDQMKPYVKLGHNEETKINVPEDGQPALGWVKSLSVVGSKLVATLTQVPGIIMKAIEAGLYKRVSSEVYRGFQIAGKRYKNVLAAVSLLGADMPAVTSLEDLDMYLSQRLSPDSSFETLITCSFDVKESKIIDKREVKNMPDNGLLNKEVKELSTKLTKAQEDIMNFHNELAKKETELKEKERILSEKDSEIKTFAEKEKERILAEETATKKASEDGLKEFCEAQVKDGFMTPAARDVVVNAVEAKKHLFTKDNGITIPIEVMKEMFSKQDKVISFKETGVSPKGGTFESVQTELDTRVRKYIKEHPDTSYAEAVQLELSADTKLATAYLDEKTGGDE